MNAGSMCENPTAILEVELFPSLVFFSDTIRFPVILGVMKSQLLMTKLKLSRSKNLDVLEGKLRRKRAVDTEPCQLGCCLWSRLVQCRC